MGSSTSSSKSEAPSQKILAVTKRYRLGSSKHGQCTHLTMTRLYTDEFRCSVCFREGSLGWLWRCTQDRELLLEDDLDRGFVEKFDDLNENFELSKAPKKRSPAARMSKLSFLEEISDEELKNYSSAQVHQILKQRSDLLDTIATIATSTALHNSLNPDQETQEKLYASPTTSHTNNNNDRNSLSPSRHPSKAIKKPWMPLRGGECQFKCCHHCRPTLLDRSYLSLNAVVDGDVPMTAIMGFGFHLKKERPVADVDVVKGLGLRPCPVTPKQEMQEKTSRQSLLSNRTADSTTSTMPSIGLGILGTERPHTHIPSIATVLTANKGATSVAPPPGFPPQTHRPLPILPYESTTTTSIKAEDNTGANTNKPLPNLPNTKPHLTISTNTYHPSRPELPLRQMPSFSRACTTPLPLSTAEEEELMGRPLTPMEKDEASKGKFGNLPLDVGTGVAVTEEGVGGHWADVVTQF